MTGPWTLTIDQLGRPTTTNHAHQMHHHQVSADRKLWRQAGCVLARALRIPPLEAITVTCWGVYPTRRSLPDVDAVAPALKGVIDGLVDAGVVVDDSADFVPEITYRAPVVQAECRPGLVVVVSEARPVGGA